eukprot:3721326-Amphidinium_carterae.3
MELREVGHSRCVRLCQHGASSFTLIHDITGERVQLETGTWDMGFNADDMSVLCCSGDTVNEERIVFGNDLLQRSLHETLEVEPVRQVRSPGGHMCTLAELEQEPVRPMELVVNPTTASPLHLMIFTHGVPVERCLHFIGLARLADFMFQDLTQQPGFVAKRIPQWRERVAALGLEGEGHFRQSLAGARQASRSTRGRTQYASVKRGEEDYSVSSTGALFLLSGLSSSAKGSKLVGLGTSDQNTAVLAMRGLLVKVLGAADLLLHVHTPPVRLDLCEGCCHHSALLAALPHPWKTPTAKALETHMPEHPVHIACIVYRLVEHMTMDKASKNRKQLVGVVVRGILLSLGELLDLRLSSHLDADMSQMPVRASAKGRARPVEQCVKSAVAGAALGSASKRSFLRGAAWGMRKRRRAVGAGEELVHKEASYGRYLESRMHAYWLSCRQFASTTACITLSFDGVKRANGEELLTVCASSGKRNRACWLPVQVQFHAPISTHTSTRPH